MPITQELTIRMENRPGSLGKVCRELADQGVEFSAGLNGSTPPASTIFKICIQMSYWLQLASF
jgi:hypothetical protein